MAAWKARRFEGAKRWRSQSKLFITELGISTGSSFLGFLSLDFVCETVSLVLFHEGSGPAARDRMVVAAALAHDTVGADARESAASASS